MSGSRRPTIEIVVPVRPGQTCRFPIAPDTPTATTQVISCRDGNISRLWRDAYVASRAEIVIFRHDDVWFRDGEDLEKQLQDVTEQYPIVGVAGATSYSPSRQTWFSPPAVWRGMVSHPPLACGSPDAYVRAFFGPAGPAVVLDGCAVAVRRNRPGGGIGPYGAADVASWWDVEFPFHFYDIAFTLNASLAFYKAGLGPPCYVIITDVVHKSHGSFGEDHHRAWQRFVAKYAGVGTLESYLARDGMACVRRLPPEPQNATLAPDQRDGRCDI